MDEYHLLTISLERIGYPRQSSYSLCDLDLGSYPKALATKMMTTNVVVVGMGVCEVGKYAEVMIGTAEDAAENTAEDTAENA